MMPKTSSFTRCLAPALTSNAGIHIRALHRRGLVMRVFDAIMASRQRQAERDIARLMRSHRRGVAYDRGYQLERRFRVGGW